MKYAIMLFLGIGHSRGWRGSGAEASVNTPVRSLVFAADTAVSWRMLLGRRQERELLDGLITAVRKGDSRVLVLEGEAGVGKTALLDLLVDRADGCRVARVIGMQFGTELAYAGVHQLCAPFLDRVGHLPAPQGAALEIALGARAGVPPDRFLVALAVLGLLSVIAKEAPLVCIVDDFQWLDRSSSQALAFVARRLHSESVGLIFAVRDGHSGLGVDSLPHVHLDGLGDDDAASLLAAVVHVPLDARVRQRILTEARGNPLAIQEISRTLTDAELQSGVIFPGTGTASELEASFAQRWSQLPAELQQLLLVAAAEPFADTAMIWGAAELLGITPYASGPAVAAGLCAADSTVRFRHPLVRSGIYHAASPDARRVVHQALADVAGADSAHEWRVWHVARAQLPPDEDVAAELTTAAERTLARGAPAAAAALLREAATYTVDPELRSVRALAAAQAGMQSGQHTQALASLSIAQGSSSSAHTFHRAELIRAQIGAAAARGSGAVPALLAAAKHLEPLDPALARATYLEAFAAALFASSLAVPGGTLHDVASHAHAVQLSPEPTPSDLLLRALAARILPNGERSTELMRAAFDALLSARPVGVASMQALWVAGIAAVDMWEHQYWDRLTDLHVSASREAGAISQLPLALSSRQGAVLFSGDFELADLIGQECAAAAEATESRNVPYTEPVLTAWRGDEAASARIIGSYLNDATARGEGGGVAFMHWARALLANSSGRHAEALVAAREAAKLRHPFDTSSNLGLMELVEAAARTNAHDEARAAITLLEAGMNGSQSTWGRGILARSRALVSAGEDAEEEFRDAIANLERGGIGTELARTHMMFGEWLRRARRIQDARTHLREAHDRFRRMGAAALAARTARELRASGTTVTSVARTDRGLTPQEEQIVRLTAEGLTNPEIAERLFLSPRTVEYHLGKVYNKLGISSRVQLIRKLNA
ncbi:LuxR C-terminal-related transcriptional regulator [Microbacterium sp. zg.B48]|uniref:LuxR C-terminal-related transcriptional regulator n=1 Tax=Microbacterium sp. zg.B48 TaxID=2969408 RepID=UPI00214BF769|nr:LuxR C-terminal-related transcriptional regulator [Microbacterium sp. zg.B48]MCR2764379.1 LuxR C-terminal-related transcriptional regulator [Microbacterium sp. zg.B48]